MVTADLLSRARAGDGEAFRELTGPHRRELQVHCYRMLGSFADAEDAVQETMLAAWQGIGGFTEERASLRTWLYKIATNRCLNARRAASRRPAREWDVSQYEPLVPTPRDEAVWLQPFPDALLEGAADVPPGPEARYEQTEAISLAFVTALQLLPPRQVAVLILRDVLGFHASEVAGMLEVTLESANSTLKRARASLQRRQQPAAGHQPPPAAGSPAEDAIVAKFARAWESADLDALVALLTDDVFIAMPPVALRIRGPGRRDPLLRQPVRRGPQVRPRPGASQRPAGVRSLPARPGRHPPRDRLLRAHPGRRPDLRHHPLRGQRAAVVRAAALTPEPVAIVIRLYLARGWRTDLPRLVLLLQAGNAVSFFGYGLILPFEIIYLHQIRGFATATAGLVLATILGTATLVTPPTGTLLDHFRPKPILIAGNLTSALGYAGFAFVDRPWQAFACAVVGGAGVGAARTANQTLLITLVTPEQRAASFALGRVASSLGLGSLATVAGFIVASAQHLRSFQTLYLFDAMACAKAIAASDPSYRTRVGSFSAQRTPDYAAGGS